MKKKTAPKIVNWREYNQALVNRGSVTFWVDEEAIANWYCQGRSGRRGASDRYSDLTIQTALMIKVLFSLPLRSVEGFLRSLFKLMALDLDSPDYSTLSKRAKRLEIAFPWREVEGHCHVVVDGTGLKVYGEGEWKVRTHGVGKRRVWRKLRLAVDAESHEILSAVVTSCDYHDGDVLPTLLEDITVPIERLYGDGAYDRRAVYGQLIARGTEPVIPPRRSAVSWGKDPPRTQILAQCHRDGRKGWKRKSGYHRRSLAETAMYRYKQLISPKLAAREFNRQATEAGAGVAVINKMNSLGMPRRVQYV